MTQRTSHSQRVGFFEEALEQANRAEPRRERGSRDVRHFFGEVRAHLAVTEFDYVEPKTVYETSKVTTGTSDTGKWRTRSRHNRTTRLGIQWGHPETGMSYRANGSTKWNWEPVVKSTNKKQALWWKASKKEWLDYFETFAPTIKPETFRILHLGLSANHGHVMHQFDVETVFLN